MGVGAFVAIDEQVIDGGNDRTKRGLPSFTRPGRGQQSAIAVREQTARRDIPRSACLVQKRSSNRHLHRISSWQDFLQIRPRQQGSDRPQMSSSGHQLYSDVVRDKDASSRRRQSKK
jgi:hypothetical protein